MPADRAPFRFLVDGSRVDQAPPPERILRTLKPGHPRLLLGNADLTRLRGLVRDDAVAGRVYAGLRAEAQAILEQHPSEYAIYDGRRLLQVSRTVKERVRTLGLVYLLEGGEPYAQRIWREVEAAIAFKDWNPSHFLDTAEMTHAVGLAYDWLYAAWSDARRSAMCDAIVRLGLEPGMSVYRGEQPHRWHENVNNWNQVCNGGLSMGALAIADRVPDLAGRVLHEALRSLPLAMNHYAPDGGGTEGVTYWEYGSRYNILHLASLESALGTDFGLSEMDGFWQSGLYQMYMAGAGRMAMDFADCALRPVSSPMHFWMGRRYGAAHYAWFRHGALAALGAQGTALDLLWYDASAKDYDPDRLPLDRHFRGAECAAFHGAWADPEAIHVGLQAGLNSYHGHRHQDLGSLIVDALGRRWIEDSGREEEVYQLHRHQRMRWEYYRIRAEGHNTLVLNPGEGPDQRIESWAPITRFESRPDGALAVVDLSDAYAQHAIRVVRTVEMPGRTSVRVTDLVETDAPAEAWWFFHTHAQVALEDAGRAARLRLDGKEMVVRMEEGPEGASFEVLPAVPLATSPNPPEQALDPHMRKLAVHLSSVTNVRMTVRMTPVW